MNTYIGNKGVKGNHLTPHTYYILLGKHINTIAISVVILIIFINLL
jgi:hypothetical protein